MYFTYVLYSQKFDKIYVGISSDVEKRLIAHNDVRNVGWTKRFQPWSIIHVEEFDTKPLALTRERQLKTSRGRDFIRKNCI